MQPVSNAYQFLKTDMFNDKVYVVYAEVSDQYGTSEPIGVFLKKPDKEDIEARVNRRCYIKAFPLDPEVSIFQRHTPLRSYSEYVR